MRSFGVDTTAQFSGFQSRYQTELGLVVGDTPEAPAFFGFVAARASESFSSVTITSNFAGTAGFDNITFDRPCADLTGLPDIATFATREAWLAAACGAAVTEDFNDVTEDFIIDPDAGGGPFTRGDMTITEVGTQQINTRIDAVPFLGVGLDVDGSSHLLSSTQAGDTRVTVITFARPVRAFAADTRAQFDNYVMNYATEAGAVSIPAPTTNSFVGFVSTNGTFTSITINSNFAGAIGFDNVAYVE